MTAADHDRLLARATRRARDVEDRLAGLLEPILNRAGDEAARSFSARVTDHLNASARLEGDRRVLGELSASERHSLGASLVLTAAASSPGSTMIALYPRPDEAAELAQPDGEPAGVLHITLAYLGETQDSDLPAIREALGPIAAAYAPLVGEVAGIGAFGSADDEEAPAILLPDVPGLVELRIAVCEALHQAGLDYSRSHGFAAHVTVGYSPTPSPPDAAKIGLPLHFDGLIITRGDVREESLPLVGAPPVTASAWTAPVANELIDIDALVQTLRTKTDPVRVAFIEALMTPALEAAGLRWDVTNPFTAKVLSQSGSQIVNIAETTQENVMKTIAAAYKEGLSIPDTAKAIRAGMREATPARARLIARTEMVGATQGGSLAATQIVAAATGASYLKEWLVGFGAKHPRHELYFGLNHQMRKLDEPFDVGGHPLDYPGDPAGPPHEVCNCLPGWQARVSVRATALVERLWEGLLVRIATAEGDDLAATSNHPVLTRRGWRPVSTVEPGDYVLCCTDSWASAGAVDPDVAEGEPTAEQVARAIVLAAGGRERVPATLVDLDGQVIDGNVHVVRADLALAFGSHAEQLEQLSHLSVHRGKREVRSADDLASLEVVAEPDLVRLGARPSVQAEFVEDRNDHVAGNAEFLRHTKYGRIGVMQATDLVMVEGAPLDCTSRRQTTILERLRYDPLGDAELLGDPGDGHEPLPMEFGDLVSEVDATLASRAAFAWHRVTSRRVQWYAGSLYDFETSPGLFSAGGVVLGNCRCSVSYKDEAAAATEEPAAAPAQASVEAPVSTEASMRTQELGLETWPPKKSALANRILRSADETHELYAADAWASRADLHQSILDRLFEGTTTASDHPTAFFTAGGAASGKSAARFTFGRRSRSIAELGSRADTVVIDPDAIKAMIPEYKALLAARDPYASFAVHEESSYLAKKATAMARDKRFNIVIDGVGGSGPGKFIAKLEDMRQAGYRVQVSMVSAPVNRAVERMISRGDRTGRYVGLQQLRAGHRESALRHVEWRNSYLVDRWTLYDTTTAEGKLVAEFKAGRILVYDEDAYARILAKGQADAPHVARIPLKPPRTTSAVLDLHPATAADIERLRIPPAWRDVRVANDPFSALQAVGIDSKGRTQYRYSADHVERSSQEKFARVTALDGELRSSILPSLRRDVEAGREEAQVLNLIVRTGFRVGSERETGAAVRAYGATTLRAEHVKISGSRVTFDFVGKKGVRVEKTVADADLAAMLRPRVTRGGRLFDVTDAQVRDYLHSIDGPFKVKDLRTWIGTALAREAVVSLPKPTTLAAARRLRRRIGEQVAAELGNTPAVALASYIDPRVFGPWGIFS